MPKFVVRGEWVIEAATKESAANVVDNAVNSLQNCFGTEDIDAVSEDFWDGDDSDDFDDEDDGA